MASQTSYRLVTDYSGRRLTYTEAFGGERVYWAIPMRTGEQTPERLFNRFSDGGWVDNEHAIDHVHVDGVLAPLDFLVDGKKANTNIVSRMYVNSYRWGNLYYQQFVDITRYTAMVRTHWTSDHPNPWKDGMTAGEEYSLYIWSAIPDDPTVGVSMEVHTRSWWVGSDGTEHITSQGTQHQYAYPARAVWVQYPVFDYAEIVNSVLAQNPEPEGIESELCVKASEQMQYSANNIANAMEFGDIAMSLTRCLLDLKSGGLGKAGKKIYKRILSGTSNPRAFGSQLKELSSSAWLGYRYSYNTTKSDAEDFIDKFDRIEDNTESGEFHILRAGSSRGRWEYHVKIRSKDRKLYATAEAHRRAMTHGTALTPYNLWDLVPFSFMVDWFIPIGDTLKLADVEFFYHSVYYDILSYTFSRKLVQELDVDGTKLKVTVYSRSVAKKVPTISCVTAKDPSSKTVFNRVLDAGAIFLGGA